MEDRSQYCDNQRDGEHREYRREEPDKPVYFFNHLKKRDKEISDLKDSLEMQEKKSELS